MRYRKGFTTCYKEHHCFQRFPKTWFQEQLRWLRENILYVAIFSAQFFAPFHMFLEVFQVWDIAIGQLYNIQYVVQLSHVKYVVCGSYITMAKLSFATPPLRESPTIFTSENSRLQTHLSCPVRKIHARAHLRKPYANCNFRNSCWIATSIALWDFWKDLVDERYEIYI